jgi:hypothetical protein
MFYNTHERERRFARMLVELEPSPEFLARCLRGRSHIGVTESEDSHPNSDAAPGANGRPRQPHVIP